jgi:glutaredoxin
MNNNKKNNYYITAILLDSCHYSTLANKLLNKYNIPHKIINVDNKTKNIYKSNIIHTYPQLYLNKLNSKGNLLLGGYNDLLNFITNFSKQPIDKTKINLFMKKNKWSLKSTIRLIQLIN